LSTGRAAPASSKILDQLSLGGYHIFFDGALASNPETGEEIFVQPISREVACEAAEFAHRNEINLDLYSTTRYFVEQETWVSDIRRNFFFVQPTVVDFVKLCREERIIKGTLVVSSVEERSKAEAFRLHFKNYLDFSETRTPAYPGIDFINVLAPQVSKGKALEALAAHLNVALTEVMAIGDGANDISLLSRAGLAVAMGNASAGLKAVADHVTLDVEHNGFATAVHRFLLG